jgi:hypothetical protein
MEKTQEIEKPDFFATIKRFFEKIKHRLARGVVIAGVSYVVFMIILMATNRTNVGADVLLLWMLVPVIYLSLAAAVLAEASWSLAVHYTKKAQQENQTINPDKEES